MSLRISVVIPALNEAGTLPDTLRALQPMRRRGHEVIVVDGGSNDATRALAVPLADKVIGAPRGRARQMNAGAAQARGDVLWFLHADTVPVPEADESVLEMLAKSPRSWGRFAVRLSGGHRLLRLVEGMMNLRSCLTGIATGDQGIFVRRAVFDAVAGFADIPLMEDIALCRRLRRHSRPICIRRMLVTSSRRWEERGVIKTVITMWWLRLAYFLGADPRRLAAWYR
jgi:rSAM/selenodomain-associated transferase 2